MNFISLYIGFKSSFLCADKETEAKKAAGARISLQIKRSGLENS